MFITFDAFGAQLLARLQQVPPFKSPFLRSNHQVFHSPKVVSRLDKTTSILHATWGKTGTIT